MTDSNTAGRRVHGGTPPSGPPSNADAPVTSRFEATLYSHSKPARALSRDEAATLEVSQHDLLWIDLCAPIAAQLHDAVQVARLPSALATFAGAADPEPELRNLGQPFGVRVLVADFDTQLRFAATPLVVLCGTNVVVTIAPRPLPSIVDLRRRQQQNSELGSLSSQSFTTSLLDGQLATYYDAMSRFEDQVEHLEIKLLAGRQGDCLEQLRALRKAASRLRRMLSAHRPVYGGLARPDFQPNQDHAVDAHFAALESRYERAMDLAEHGRDLVVGTFELFTTRAAMSTNETMKVLTFATVLIGGLAVVAGVLGMNFDAAFFQSRERGFWAAVGAMVALAAAALWLGRRRDWF